MKDFPTQAQAVIIGGGIIGCSTAYHLARLGWDVVLLERHKLTSGSTFHAAGLVGQLRSNANITRLLGYSVDLYRGLEAETGLATGWKMNGGLRLACSEERWEEVRRQATTARSFGLEMALLSPKEAQDLWPLMRVDDVIGAAFLPTDGQANPSDITQSLARGARMKGALILEDVKVLSVEVEKGVIRGVETTRGHIAAPVVIACAGQWTRALAKSVGVNVPLVSVQHQYMVTEPIAGVPPDLPTLRDPDRLTYYKEEVGGLVMGGYEPNPLPWAENGIPPGFHFSLLESDFDHFQPLMELALGRVPALENAGVRELVNGPESFTPDGNFILGEAPELRNFFVGAGFNAFGIAAGGGAGMALAEWVANGAPPFDLWPADIRRFGQPHFDDDWIRTRTHEAYGRHYAMAWPAEEYETARPCRRSPLYERLREKGAVFGEKLGWERPNWFDAVGREHRAGRSAAVLFDQTSFAKFILKGPDALPALQWICANRMERPVGAITYTQMLNERGGIESDLTITRLAEDEFYIVTGTAQATRDLAWIARNIPKGANAQLFDVTSANAVLEAFPFATARRIAIAGCPVLALRITYVGELGWELHLPVEHAPSVYDALQKAGAAHGLRDAGYRAIESMRLEKGYRAWGSDIGPDHTPLEAGLGWAVKLGSDTDFIGRAALEAQRRAGVKKLMAGFLAAPEVVLHGRETIYRNGARVGWLSSGGFGHTLGRSIGYGYVRNPEGVDEDFVLSGAYELEVATERVPCEVSLRPFHDPGNLAVKR